MRSLLLTLLCGALFFAPQQILLAQAPGLVLAFPRDGLADVEHRPTITIRTPAPIMPESITFTYPDADVYGMVAATPTVLLVADPFDGPQRELVRRSVLGTYDLVDQQTLTFTPRTLDPHTRYRVVVSGIDVDANGPVRMATTTAEFTTAAAIPTVKGSSLDATQTIGCGDTITIGFTGDVLAGLGDPHRYLAVEQLHDAIGWEPLPFGIFPDSNRLHLLPEGRWPVGAVMRIRADLHQVTGDTLDDRVFATVVRSAGKLRISVIEQDGEVVPDDIRDDFNHMEYMVTGQPPNEASIDRREDLWRFVRWESPLLTPRDPDDTSQHVTIDCSLLRDEIPLTAILDHLDSLPLSVTTTAGGVIRIYDKDNTLITTVTDSTEVAFDPDEGGLRFVAIADSGYTFSGWTSPSTSHHGSASGSIVINGASLSNAIQQWQHGTTGPQFGGSFNPSGRLSEIYALKGAIEDVDATPGFDVYEGVAFTTEHEFEEVVATERTICAKAEPCWEIIGYTESARNKMVWIEPTDEYCVTAPLTDPENHVVFLVKRTTIHLRVEQVLLASDKPDDRVFGKDPHPETYVRVDKRYQGADGKNYWRSMVPVPCRDLDIMFSTYEVQCGDVVRFRTKGSDVRGQTWKFFDNRELYAIPDQTGTVNEEHRFEMVIDEDIAHFVASNCHGAVLNEPEIRTRACFRQDFGIEAIAMTVRVTEGTNRGQARWEERWYDPVWYRPLADDEPRGGRHLEYIPRFGTEVKVRFTLPIDLRTIYDGGIRARSFANTLVTDPLLTGLDFTVASDDDEHVSFEPTDGSPITTVVFRVCNPQSRPRFQSLHGGMVSLSATTQVRSLAGTPLPASFNFLLSSVERPGYGLMLRDITYRCDGDPDFIWENDGEMYHVTYGGNLGWDQARYEEAAFTRIPDCRQQQGTPPGECTLPHSDKAGPQNYGDRLLWIEPHWMDDGDLAWWHIQSYDEDCKDDGDCFVNRAQDLLDELSEEIGTMTTTDPSAPLSWESLLPSLINNGVDFLRALLPPDEQDDHVGEGTFLNGKGNWWGVKSAAYPLWILDRSNARYRLVTRLFVTKMPIR